MFHPSRPGEASVPAWGGAWGDAGGGPEGKRAVSGGSPSPPAIKVASSRVSTCTGQPTTLVCALVGCPQPTLQW